MEKTRVMLLWQTRRIIETWMRKRACGLFVCFLLVRPFSCFLLQRKDFGCVGGVEIWAAFLSRCCIWDRAQDFCNWAWEKAVSIDPIFTQFEHLCSIRCTSERESVHVYGCMEFIDFVGLGDGGRACVLECCSSFLWLGFSSGRLWIWSGSEERTITRSGKKGSSFDGVLGRMELWSF